MSIADNYGRKLGLLHHMSARTAQWLGAYNACADIAWKDVRRIVYVCDGNICRSPYGEAHARALGVEAGSFGLRAAPGAPADPVAIDAAARRGIDLHAHRAAAVESYRPRAGDLLLAMEPRQVRALRSRVGNAVPVSLLGLWALPARPHLEDPFGLAASYFDTCFRIIDAATRRIRTLIAQPPSGAP